MLVVFPVVGEEHWFSLLPGAFTAVETEMHQQQILGEVHIQASLQETDRVL